MLYESLYNVSFPRYHEDIKHLYGEVMIGCNTAFECLVFSYLPPALIPLPKFSVLHPFILLFLLNNIYCRIITITSGRGEVVRSELSGFLVGRKVLENEYFYFFFLLLVKAGKQKHLSYTFLQIQFLDVWFYRRPTLRTKKLLSQGKLVSE